MSQLSKLGRSSIEIGKLLTKAHRELRVSDYLGDKLVNRLHMAIYRAEQVVYSLQMREGKKQERAQKVEDRRKTAA
jgi:hypothetical protein